MDWKQIGKLLHRLDVRTHSKWLLLSVLIGIVAGLGAILFQVLTQIVMAAALAGVAGFQPGEPAG